MSARATGFAELLRGFQNAIGMSAATLTATQKASFALFLNSGYRWAWRKPKDRPWPEAVTGASKTPTAGVIAWSAIGYAEHYRVWSADPRPITSTAYRIDSTRDADGIHVKSDVSPVWVEYLPRTPEFSGTAYSAVTAYAVDDLILFTDDNCYRCVTATSAGENPTTHAAKWEAQTALKMLAAATIYEAASQYFQSIASEGRSAKAHEDAIDDIEGEWITAFPKNAVHSYPPLGWR